MLVTALSTHLRSWQPNLSLDIANDPWVAKLPSVENHWFTGKYKSLGVTNATVYYIQQTDVVPQSIFLYAVLLTLHYEAVLIISTEVCVFERLLFGLGIQPLFSELDAICDSDF